MEIRCTNCKHIGPAAEIKPGPNGVALVCENCGHENELNMGGAPTPAPASDTVASRFSGPVVPTSNAPVERPSSVDLSADEVLQKLIPEPGEGLRCPKCVALVRADDDHCPKCGLDLVDAARYPEGRGPWESAPKGREQSHEQALRLWGAATEAWSAESLEKFVNFVRDEHLHETGIRLLRMRLVDHPDDPLVIQHLEVLAHKMRSRLVTARAQAEVSAKSFENDVARWRVGLTVITLVFWGAIFVVFLSIFVDNC